MAFRRTIAQAAVALDMLIVGPPELAEGQSDSSTTHGEGEGGGVRSETFGSETLDPKIEESERERSETFRRARECENADVDAIAASIAHELGDAANVAAIRRLVTTHPEQLVRDALARTLAIPSERIRGSRGALFTGIVRKLAKQALPPNP
ncbi:MAG: hypothetical protein IT379_14945 [Deltaproteobacteria bacterium]|nr:hypothetical protein [Deltaproteobacteria bacterium]